MSTTDVKIKVDLDGDLKARLFFIANSQDEDPSNDALEEIPLKITIL